MTELQNGPLRGQHLADDSLFLVAASANWPEASEDALCWKLSASHSVMDATPTLSWISLEAEFYAAHKFQV